MPASRASFVLKNPACPEKGDHPMLKKALLAAAALGVLAGSAMAQDVKVLRIGLDGSENEADQIRHNECVAQGLKAFTGVEDDQIFPSPDYNRVIQGLLAAPTNNAPMGAPSSPSLHLQNTRRLQPTHT